MKTQKPKVLMLVHVLGLVCDIVNIKNLCQQYNVILIEDTCESLGSKFNNQLLGSFGDMSTFSFYFGHHISTIEGGMLCTNDKKLDNLFRSIRNHGWDRDWDKQTQEEMRAAYNVNEFDALYTFYHSGFNLRATDLQAFIGLGQLKKVDSYCDRRNKNYALYHNLLKSNIWKPKLKDNTYVSNFAWPILSNNKAETVKALKDNNIECRPLICGSMGKQPFYTKQKGECKLPNADYIHTNGVYVPNHQSMTDKDVADICKIINDTN
jgi:CDP-6-deoxy-D-xylo-4-hexulose-3-dehydrase